MADASTTTGTAEMLLLPRSDGTLPLLALLWCRLPNRLNHVRIRTVLRLFHGHETARFSRSAYLVACHRLVGWVLGIARITCAWLDSSTQSTTFRKVRIERFVSEAARAFRGLASASSRGTGSLPMERQGLFVSMTRQAPVCVASDRRSFRGPSQGSHVGRRSTLRAQTGADLGSSSQSGTRVVVVP